MLSLLSHNQEMKCCENGFAEILSGGGVPEFENDLPENRISVDGVSMGLEFPSMADNLPAVGLLEICQ